MRFTEMRFLCQVTEKAINFLNRNVIDFFFFFLFNIIKVRNLSSVFMLET